MQNVENSFTLLLVALKVTSSLYISYISYISLVQLVQLVSNKIDIYNFYYLKFFFFLD